MHGQGFLPVFVLFELVHGSFVISCEWAWTLIIWQAFNETIRGPIRSEKIDILVCEMNVQGVTLSKTFFTKRSTL